MFARTTFPVTENLTLQFGTSSLTRRNYSEVKEISAGVPQGSVLGSDLQARDGPTIANFGEGISVEETTEKLQAVSGCFKNWRIKFNEAKSVHVNFTKLSYHPRLSTIRC